MINYVGIDLGTTNSAICTYDDSQTRIWKSPEQNDVTPSAIYIDRRGNKYIGQRAYDAAQRSPDNCATLFKRFMGTSTPIELSAVNLTLTPEECSAEILKTLSSYLPEEIRNFPDIGTVITVPAAFNQMQKDATMKAAEMAGIGKIVLLQEPVAAVMSAMKGRSTDGIFLIYDLGGGTLDIAIAESIRGRVTLLAQGGIQMCGGRDFDRLLVDNLVRPWLHENFELPDDLSANPTFKPLLRLAMWATERAKIELSARDETMISLSEAEMRTNDLNGEEIYLEIPLQRHPFDELIANQVNDTITAARETLSETGLTPNDLESIVWVGGPTHYKPLRDKVSFELGIKSDTLAVNPMTAVAEGASIFAESIDWRSKGGETKDTRGETLSSTDLGLTFVYTARTSEDKSKIAVRMTRESDPGAEFQIDSLDTGWTSGRLPLTDGTIADVGLTKPGENTFKITAYDAAGRQIIIDQDEIVITKTAATVEGIPASHSIALEVLDRLGGRSVPAYLIRKGDKIPKKGNINLKAGELLESGSSRSLNFKLWEGEIENPVDDNRPAGILRIRGSEFDHGTIPVNADLKCDYVIPEGGQIKFEVEIECINQTFNDVYFYEDMTPNADQVVQDVTRIRSRIDEIKESVDDPKLQQAEEKLKAATPLDPQESDSEKVLSTNEGVLAAKKLLSDVRKDNLKELRQIDLDAVVEFFDMYIRQHARPSEETEFDKLVETAQRSIDNNDNDFEDHLGELKGRNFEILYRQDWFVIEQFNYLANSFHLFADQDRFEELVHVGNRLMKHPEIQGILSGERETTIKSEVVDQLRGVVAQIMSIPRIGGVVDHDEMQSLITNILTG